MASSAPKRKSNADATKSLAYFGVLRGDAGRGRAEAELVWGAKWRTEDLAANPEKP
jgi:hypothetical protein